MLLNMPVKISRPEIRISLAVLAALSLAACARSPEAKEARFIGRGKEAMAQKEYRKASLEFLNAAHVMPNDAEAWYQLGKSYLAAGSYQEAGAALMRATELNPKHVQAQLALAAMMAASRDSKPVAEALDRLTGILGIAPGNPDVMDVIALIKLRLGKQDEAEQEFEDALGKMPAHLETSVDLARLKLMNNDVAAARQVLENAVKANPQSARAALLLGRFYQLTGDRQRGESEVRRALHIDPKNASALLTLAEIQLGSGRSAEAEQTYKQLSALPGGEYKSVHAAFLFETGRRGEAVAEFERLAKDSPGDRAARTRLVAACFSTGRDAEAERILKDVLRKNPRDVEALLQRSRVYLADRRYNDAESDLRQVLNFQPDSARAHDYLAKIYQVRGATLNQQQELTRAITSDPGFLAARVELADLLVASNKAQAALETMNDTPVGQRRNTQAIGARNWALLAVNDNAAARKGVDEGLAIARTPELLLEDGALKLAKNPAAAQASIEEALKVSPDSVPAWEFLRRACAARRQPELALEKLQTAAAQQPRSAPVQMLLGNWLADAGKIDEARQAYEAAKKADPASLSSDIALAQLDMTQGHMDAARQRLTAVATAQPRNVTAHVLLGEIAKKSGDRNTAIAQYRAILAVDQRSLIALNDLAFMLVQDSPDEALKYAQEAGEIAPDNPSVQDTLGWVYYRNGVYTSAIQYLKTAVHQDRTPLRQYHLGMAYLKSGDHDLGQQMVNSALAADPTLASVQSR